MLKRRHQRGNRKNGKLKINKHNNKRKTAGDNRN
jgi:hypothetical protein